MRTRGQGCGSSSSLVPALAALAFVAMQEQGKLEESLPLYQEALGIYTEILGEEHSSVASLHANVGLLFKRMAETKKGPKDELHLAADTYEPNRRRANEWGDGQPVGGRVGLAPILLLVASVVSHRAVEHLQKALAIRRRLLDSDDPQIAVALHQLASAVRIAQGPTAAEKLAREAVDRLRAKPGTDRLFRGLSPSLSRLLLLSLSLFPPSLPLSPGLRRHWFLAHRRIQSAQGRCIV